jgi:zinc D-Ala-D-Ala dipeptidase
MLIKINQSDKYIIDIRYASANNFTGAPIYKKPEAWLHKEAFLLLNKAAEIAASQGYKIRIFDAYRPIEVQQALWNHTPDPEFLSDPSTGSVPHCRGVAVDLTLVKDDVDLDMGTEFDEFSVRSHHGYMDFSAEIIRNRLILMGIMTTAGWDFYRNEWWHYQLFKPREYEIISAADSKTGLY